MEADLYSLLDSDWAAWRRRTSATRALARWQAFEPALRQVSTLQELMAVFENRTILDTRDEMLLALIALAPGDCDAHRAVLQILRPGLIALTTRAMSWWGWEDASSAVVAAAVDRISRYPKYRAHRVAANLLGDVWHSVWAQRKLELRRRAGSTEEPLGLESAELVAASSEPGHGDEVMALIEEAVLRQRISPDDGRLVAMHRVAGYTNVELGRMEGKQACTIRKRRAAAEAEIAALAVA
jgi:hypothetical protein